MEGMTHRSAALPVLLLVAISTPVAGQSLPEVCGALLPEVTTGPFTISAPPGSELPAVSVERELHAEYFRVVDGVLLEGGGAVVANAGASELLYFSPDGARVARAGGPGGGPREFMRLTSARQGAGSGILSAWDASYGLKRFGIDGEFIDATPLRGGVPRVDGFAVDGGVVVVEARAGARNGSVLERSYAVVLIAPDGRSHDVRIERRPDQILLQLDHGFSALSMPFVGPFWVEPVGGGCVLLGDPESPDLEIVDLGGTSRARIELPWIDTALSEEVWDAWTEERVRTGGHEDEWDFDDVPRPRARGAWRSAFMDTRGLIWAEPDREDDEPRDRILRVDLRTASATWVALPPRTSRVLDAEGDRVLLVILDDLDVEHVVVGSMGGP